MSALDVIDRQLLKLLQANDRASLAELGEAVGLAPSSVNERIKRLTELGTITGFHARVAPKAVGLSVLAYVSASLASPQTEARFLKHIAREPTVLECHRVTGAWDYLLKVRVRNIEQLERFLAEMLKIPGLQRTDTLIVLSSAKETTTIPIDLPVAPAATPPGGRSAVRKRPAIRRQKPLAAPFRD